MKYFFVSILLFIFQVVSAQEIMVTPNPILDWQLLGTSEILGKAIIRNDSDIEKTYTWERTILCENGINQTWFCDPNACYIPNVIDGQFTLPPGAEGPFEFHATFSAPANNTIVAQIKIFENGNENNILDVLYEYNSSSCAVGIDVLEVEDIQLFPNPTKDQFTLANIGNVNEIIIYNTTNTIVKQYLAEEGKSYSIENLLSGIYIIQLIDKNGLIASKRVFKQ